MPGLHDFQRHLTDLSRARFKQYFIWSLVGIVRRPGDKHDRIAIQDIGPKGYVAQIVDLGQVGEDQRVSVEFIAGHSNLADDAAADEKRPAAIACNASKSHLAQRIDGRRVRTEKRAAIGRRIARTHQPGQCSLGEQKDGA